MLAFFATGLEACQRDRHFHHDGVNLKRQVTERLPLTPDEATITSSFDNNSISDWSYYYVSNAYVDARGSLTDYIDPWRSFGRQERVASSMSDLHGFPLCWRY